jgi:dynein light chain LC8-type
MARELKSHFDEFFYPTWQCIVGKNFGSEIGCEQGFVIYFYVGATGILLWRCG